MPFEAFDARAAEYDAWYDSQAGATIFAMEVASLKPFLRRHRRPYLEIGTGSGRFAQALGIEYGVDPAIALLHLARSRGVHVVRGVAEELPFANETFGAVLIALTLCFIDDPSRVLLEARRALVPGGGLVLGLILKGSPWAEHYARKGREGHPIFSRARFFSKAEVEDLLQQAGFEVFGYGSVLFQLPGQVKYHLENPIAGYRKSAGFVAIGSRKRDMRCGLNPPGPVA